MAALDLPPRLWAPSRPAIVRAGELPRSPAQARGIETKKAILPGTVPIVGFSAPGFPLVRSTATAATNTTETSHSISLPADIVNGELLVAVFSTVDATVSFPGGWTSLYNVLASNTVRHAAAYRYADGSEGASITVNTNNARQSTANAYRIFGASGTPEAATATGEGLNPDPPSLGPSWGSKKTLWFAATGWQTNAGISSSPTNYTDDIHVASAGGVGSERTRTASARRAFEASSENPGVFTIGGATNRIWVAAAIAVQPA